MSDGMGLAKLIVEKMHDIAHLNVVLRRKNRRIHHQHLALEDMTRRNHGLLLALHEIAIASSLEAAKRTAGYCLRFTDQASPSAEPPKAPR